MSRLVSIAAIAAALMILMAPEVSRAQSFGCEDTFKLDDKVMAAFRYGPKVPPPEPPSDPLRLRALKYAALSVKHKLSGLASYYSTSLDGTLTATGETFRNSRFTAAHLTLPLGSWVEVTSRATGRKIRCLVNDRGPYAHKFMLDLSQAAARALGVDRAVDRTVEVRVIALPGETPLPADWEIAMAKADQTAVGASAAAAAAESVVSTTQQR